MVAETVRPLFDSGKASALTICLLPADPILSPPPAKAFWQVDQYQLNVKGHGIIYVRIELEQPRHSYSISSPVNPKKMYPEIMVRSLPTYLTH